MFDIGDVLGDAFYKMVIKGAKVEYFFDSFSFDGHTIIKSEKVEDIFHEPWNREVASFEDGHSITLTYYDDLK